MRQTIGAGIGVALSLGSLFLACAGPVTSQSSGGEGGEGGEAATSVGSGSTTGTGGGGGGGGAGGGGSGGAPACTQAPLALTGDVLDPNEVYLAGTLSEGACYLDALAHWAFPSSAVVGFDCYFNELGAQIRPTDGRLLYHNTFEDILREFHCDDCPYSGSYPAAPLANDTILPTPPCDPKGSNLVDHRVSPAGTVLHRCSSGQTTWYDAAGKVVYADAQDPLRHLGYGDLALTEKRVVHLTSAASAPIVGLPPRTVYTVRAKAPDMFMVLLATEMPAPDGSGQELWEVSADGVAKLVGMYPPLPAAAKSVSFESKLEACGALVQFGSGQEVFQDIIVRREIGGASEVVYDEATNPAVKIHISGLVTGP